MNVQATSRPTPGTVVSIAREEVPVMFDATAASLIEVSSTSFSSWPAGSSPDAIKCFT